MDSPGGEVDSGIQFIEFAKTIPNLRTITIFAASMASGIVEGLPGIRLITGNGFLMFHRATGEFSGQFEMGEVEHRLALAKEVILELEKQNAARLKISIEDYKNKIKDEYWLLSKKAVLEKAADKVIDIVCSKELIDSRTVLKIDSIFGTAKYEFSNCPLFRTPLPTKKKIVAFVGLGE
jgi:ATP-dependent protease ClpP protease subunit